VVADDEELCIVAHACPTTFEAFHHTFETTGGHWYNQLLPDHWLLSHFKSGNVETDPFPSKKLNNLGWWTGELSIEREAVVIRDIRVEYSEFRQLVAISVATRSSVWPRSFVAKSTCWRRAWSANTIIQLLSHTVNMDISHLQWQLHRLLTV